MDSVTLRDRAGTLTAAVIPPPLGHSQQKGSDTGLGMQSPRLMRVRVPALPCVSLAASSDLAKKVRSLLISDFCAKGVSQPLAPSELIFASSCC